MEDFKSFVKNVLSDEKLKEVHRVYPFKITPHIFSLIKKFNSPALKKQFLPDARELEDNGGLEDPLGERDLSPVPNLIHRYPDRVLWLVTSRCGSFCRFCTRKRIWKERITLTEENIAKVVEYIKNNGSIRDVLISGGDPLLLEETLLDRILFLLRRINRPLIIRIGTRLPVSFPQKVTDDKIRIISAYKPLYVNLHVNHPLELSDDTVSVIAKMADAGIPLGSQTVLLKGVNDNREVLRELFMKLLYHRVRPYYLLQMDLRKGTSHFITPVSKALKILAELRYNLSGLAMPHFVIDLPGGGGKVELVPSMIKAIKDGKIFVKNRLGGLSFYPLQEGEEEELKRLLGLI